jgi:hypothetical protein
MDASNSKDSSESANANANQNIAFQSSERDQVQNELLAPVDRLESSLSLSSIMIQELINLVIIK